jgi:hypothetical protein
VFLDYYINDSGGYDLPRLPYAHSTGTLFRAGPAIGWPHGENLRPSDACVRNTTCFYIRN